MSAPTPEEIARAAVPDPQEAPEALSAAQAALLDAVRDIALFQEAPGAMRATDALIRLLSLSFNVPPPKPVIREGGFVSAIFGNPVKDPPGEGTP